MEELMSNSTISIVYFITGLATAGGAFVANYFLGKKKLDNSANADDKGQTWLMYQDLVKTFQKNWENAVESAKVRENDYISLREKIAEYKVQLQHTKEELEERNKELEELKKELQKLEEENEENA